MVRSVRVVVDELEYAAPMRQRSTFVVVAVGMAALGCGDPPSGRTFFERRIQPILVESCASNTSGCHVADPQDPFQVAAGNLDVSTFERIQKRRDLLVPFGPYQYPPFLIKALASGVSLQGVVDFQYDDRDNDPSDDVRPLQVLHAGGALLTVDSDAFYTLLEWLDNGATENGLPPATPPQVGDGGCSTSLPPDFDPVTFMADPVYTANQAMFASTVEPVLETCGAGSCHGAPQADFYVTCGDTPEQLAFNFSQVWAFVDSPVDDSQVLQVPLAANAGGGPHSGGDHFTGTTGDSDYDAIKSFATAVGVRPFGEGNPGKLFFAEQVQPTLIARGCAFMACHSPAAGNDLKLRTGTQGFYSAVALEKNYDLLTREFMAFEFPDARRGRAVAKNVIDVARPSGGADIVIGGIAHRAGEVLETPSLNDGNPILSDPAACPQPFNPAAPGNTAFCIVQEWVRIERQALLAAGEVLPFAPNSTTPMVYVSRSPTHVANPLDVDTHQAGSDLRRADVNLGAQGQVTGGADATSLLGGCAGVNTATADVRAPDIHRDGTSVVFAMRRTAGEQLTLWRVGIDGSGCQQLTTGGTGNGLNIHDFDPAWSPDGEWIVFASTRGKMGVGPTRSRKNFWPQADLWRMRPDGSGLEQLTYLTNSEVSPQFMREGRITMTTEKVSSTLTQLSGRRLNWDKTDYHPLLAQRAASPYVDAANPADLTTTRPSIGYGQATDIREGADGNFLVILSDAGARGGAGTLATFNRSIGPFENGRGGVGDEGYLASVHIVDPGATGRVGSATDRAYRGGVTLPDGRIMVSRANIGADLGTVTSVNWNVVAISPIDGSTVDILTGPNAEVDAVLAVKHPARQLYYNRRQLVFGGSTDPSLGDRAEIHFPDAPTVFTMLTGNLRRGRPVDQFRRATQIAFYAEQAPPMGTTSGSGPGGIFESRQLVGRAALASDGSVRVNVPAGAGVVLELQDDAGAPVVNMGEEHQLAPGERISLGIREDLFDKVCGQCHGSVSGSELDVQVSPDALTGASQSLSATSDPVRIGP